MASHSFPDRSDKFFNGLGLQKYPPHLFTRVGRGGASDFCCPGSVRRLRIINPHPRESGTPVTLRGHLLDLTLRMNPVSCVLCPGSLSSRTERLENAKEWTDLICSELLKTLKKMFFSSLGPTRQSILKNYWGTFYNDLKLRGHCHGQGSRTAGKAMEQEASIGVPVALLWSPGLRCDVCGLSMSVPAATATPRTGSIMGGHRSGCARRQITTTNCT